MVQKTNGSAIAPLVLSILGLFGIGSLLGIIFGHRARKEIHTSGGYEGGEGLATAGIVIGWVTLVLFATRPGLLDLGVHRDPFRRRQRVFATEQDRSVPSGRQVRRDRSGRLPGAEGFVPGPDSSVECRDLREQLWAIDHKEDSRPYLNESPSTVDYVGGYNSSGNVWVAPPNTFDPSFVATESLETNPNASADVGHGLIVVRRREEHWDGRSRSRLTSAPADYPQRTVAACLSHDSFLLRCHDVTRRRQAEEAQWIEQHQISPHGNQFGRGQQHC